MNIIQGIKKQIKNGEIEVWKPIEKYKGFYEVSNLGRVKSLPRRVRTGKRSFKMSEERQIKITRKYKTMTAYICKDGRPESINVAAAVWKAFKRKNDPEYEKGYRIEFKNGDYTNVSFKNLKVVNIKDDTLEKATKYMDYILKNECTRTECAIHFNMKQYTITNTIRESGLDKKYKKELNEISNKNRSRRSIPACHAKLFSGEIIRMNKKDFIENICKLKKKQMKRGDILTRAALLDVKTPMKILVKEIEQNGVEVIN